MKFIKWMVVLLSVYAVSIYGLSEAASMETTAWLTTSQYQAAFNVYWAQGYYPRFVQGKLVNGEELFQGVFGRDYGSTDWYSCHGLDSSSYATADATYRQYGLYPYWHQTFVGNGGVILHQATWLTRDMARVQNISNDVLVSDIDSNTTEVTYYKLLLPTNTKYVLISANNSDFCKITASFNTIPTQYDCMTLSGKDLLIESPPSGSIYIAVEASASGNGASLLVSASTDEITELDFSEGWIENVNVDAGKSKLYKMNVPENTSYLVYLTHAMQQQSSADLNIIARYGGLPSLSRYDYGSILQGNDERIVVENPQSGYWYLRVTNDGATDTARLLAWRGYFPTVSLSPNNYLYGIYGESNHLKSYKFTVPSGSTVKGIRISLSAGQAGWENSRVYMFLRRGGIAFFDYTARSMQDKLRQQIVVNDPEPGEWYVSLVALDDYAGAKLDVKLSDKWLAGADIGKQFQVLPFVPLLIKE